MLIDFDAIETKVIPNFKGGEGAFIADMADDGLVRIIHGRLEPGSTIGLHRHEPGCEVIYVISGTGTAIVDGEAEAMRPGVCTYCPKGSSHTVINDGDEDLEFFAVIPQNVAAAK